MDGRWGEGRFEVLIEGNDHWKVTLSVGACLMSWSFTLMTSVKSAYLAFSPSSYSSTLKDFPSTRSRSSFLLSRPSTMSEYTCPPSNRSRPFTTTP